MTTNSNFNSNFMENNPNSVPESSYQQFLRETTPKEPATNPFAAEMFGMNPADIVVDDTFGITSYDTRSQEVSLDRFELLKGKRFIPYEDKLPMDLTHRLYLDFRQRPLYSIIVKGIPEEERPLTSFDLQEIRWLKTSLERKEGNLAKKRKELAVLESRPLSFEVLTERVKSKQDPPMEIARLFFRYAKARTKLQFWPFWANAEIKKEIRKEFVRRLIYKLTRGKTSDVAVFRELVYRQWGTVAGFNFHRELMQEFAWDPMKGFWEKRGIAGSFFGYVMLNMVAATAFARPKTGSNMPILSQPYEHVEWETFRSQEEEGHPQQIVPKAIRVEVTPKNVFVELHPRWSSYQDQTYQAYWGDSKATEFNEVILSLQPRESRAPFALAVVKSQNLDEHLDELPRKLASQEWLDRSREFVQVANTLDLNLRSHSVVSLAHRTYQFHQLQPTPVVVPHAEWLDTWFMSEGSSEVHAVSEESDQINELGLFTMGFANQRDMGRYRYPDMDADQIRFLWLRHFLFRVRNARRTIHNRLGVSALTPRPKSAPPAILQTPSSQGFTRTLIQWLSLLGNNFDVAYNKIPLMNLDVLQTFQPQTLDAKENPITDLLTDENDTGTDLVHEDLLDLSELESGTFLKSLVYEVDQLQEVLGSDLYLDLKNFLLKFDNKEFIQTTERTITQRIKERFDEEQQKRLAEIARRRELIRLGLNPDFDLLPEEVEALAKAEEEARLQAEEEALAKTETPEETAARLEAKEQKRQAEEQAKAAEEARLRAEEEANMTPEELEKREQERAKQEEEELERQEEERQKELARKRKLKFERAIANIYAKHQMRKYRSELHQTIRNHFDQVDWRQLDQPVKLSKLPFPAPRFFRRPWNMEITDSKRHVKRVRLDRRIMQDPDFQNRPVYEQQAILAHDVDGMDEEFRANMEREWTMKTATSESDIDSEQKPDTTESNKVDVHKKEKQEKKEKHEKKDEKRVNAQTKDEKKDQKKDDKTDEKEKKKPTKKLDKAAQAAAKKAAKKAAKEAEEIKIEQEQALERRMSLELHQRARQRRWQQWKLWFLSGPDSSRQLAEKDQMALVSETELLELQNLLELQSLFEHQPDFNPEPPKEQEEGVVAYYIGSKADDMDESDELDQAKQKEVKIEEKPDAKKQADQKKAKKIGPKQLGSNTTDVTEVQDTKQNGEETEDDEDSEEDAKSQDGHKVLTKYMLRTKNPKNKTKFPQVLTRNPVYARYGAWSEKHMDGIVEVIGDRLDKAESFIAKEEKKLREQQKQAQIFAKRVKQTRFDLNVNPYTDLDRDLKLPRHVKNKVLKSFGIKTESDIYDRIGIRAAPLSFKPSWKAKLIAKAIDWVNGRSFLAKILPDFFHQRPEAYLTFIHKVVPGTFGVDVMMQLETMSEDSKAEFHRQDQLQTIQDLTDSDDPKGVKMNRIHRKNLVYWNYDDRKYGFRQMPLHRDLADLARETVNRRKWYKRFKVGLENLESGKFVELGKFAVPHSRQEFEDTIHYPKIKYNVDLNHYLNPGFSLDDHDAYIHWEDPRYHIINDSGLKVPVEKSEKNQFTKDDGKRLQFHVSPVQIAANNKMYSELEEILKIIEPDEVWYSLNNQFHLKLRQVLALMLKLDPTYQDTLIEPGTSFSFRHKLHNLHQALERSRDNSVFKRFCKYLTTINSLHQTWLISQEILADAANRSVAEKQKGKLSPEVRYNLPFRIQTYSRTIWPQIDIFPNTFSLFKSSVFNLFNAEGIRPHFVMHKALRNKAVKEASAKLHRLYEDCHRGVYLGAGNLNLDSNPDTGKEVPDTGKTGSHSDYRHIESKIEKRNRDMLNAIKRGGIHFESSGISLQDIVELGLSTQYSHLLEDLHLSDSGESFKQKKHVLTAKETEILRLTFEALNLNNPFATSNVPEAGNMSISDVLDKKVEWNKESLLTVGDLMDTDPSHPFTGTDIDIADEPSFVNSSSPVSKILRAAELRNKSTLRISGLDPTRQFSKKVIEQQSTLNEMQRVLARLERLQWASLQSLEELEIDKKQADATQKAHLQNLEELGIDKKQADAAQKAYLQSLEELEINKKKTDGIKKVLAKDAIKKLLAKPQQFVDPIEELIEPKKKIEDTKIPVMVERWIEADKKAKDTKIPVMNRLSAQKWKVKKGKYWEYWYNEGARSLNFEDDDCTIPAPRQDRLMAAAYNEQFDKEQSDKVRKSQEAKQAQNEKPDVDFNVYEELTPLIHALRERTQILSAQIHNAKPANTVGTKQEMIDAITTYLEQSTVPPALDNLDAVIIDDLLEKLPLFPWSIREDIFLILKAEQASRKQEPASISWHDLIHQVESKIQQREEDLKRQQREEDLKIQQRQEDLNREDQDSLEQYILDADQPDSVEQDILDADQLVRHPGESDEVYLARRNKVFTRRPSESEKAYSERCQRVKTRHEIQELQQELRELEDLRSSKQQDSSMMISEPEVPAERTEEELIDLLDTSDTKDKSVDEMISLLELPKPEELMPDEMQEMMADSLPSSEQLVPILREKMKLAAEVSDDLTPAETDLFSLEERRQYGASLQSVRLQKNKENDKKVPKRAGAYQGTANPGTTDTNANITEKQRKVTTPIQDEQFWQELLALWNEMPLPLMKGIHLRWLERQQEGHSMQKLVEGLFGKEGAQALHDKRLYRLLQRQLDVEEWVSVRKPKYKHSWKPWLYARAGQIFDRRNTLPLYTRKPRLLSKKESSRNQNESSTKKKESLHHKREKVQKLRRGVKPRVATQKRMGPWVRIRLNQNVKTLQSFFPSSGISLDFQLEQEGLVEPNKKKLILDTPHFLKSFEAFERWVIENPTPSASKVGVESWKTLSKLEERVDRVSRQRSKMARSQVAARKNKGSRAMPERHLHVRLAEYQNMKKVYQFFYEMWKERKHQDEKINVYLPGQNIPDLTWQVPLDPYGDNVDTRQIRNWGESHLEDAYDTGLGTSSQTRVPFRGLVQTLDDKQRRIMDVASGAKQKGLNNKVRNLRVKLARMKFPSWVPQSFIDEVILPQAPRKLHAKARYSENLSITGDWDPERLSFSNLLRYFTPYAYEDHKFPTSTPIFEIFNLPISSLRGTAENVKEGIWTLAKPFSLREKQPDRYTLNRELWFKPIEQDTNDISSEENETITAEDLPAEVNEMIASQEVPAEAKDTNAQSDTALQAEEEEEEELTEEEERAREIYLSEVMYRSSIILEHTLQSEIRELKTKWWMYHTSALPRMSPIQKKKLTRKLVSAMALLRVEKSLVGDMMPLSNPADLPLSSSFAVSLLNSSAPRQAFHRNFHRSSVLQASARCFSSIGDPTVIWLSEPSDLWSTRRWQTKLQSRYSKDSLQRRRLSTTRKKNASRIPGNPFSRELPVLREMYGPVSEFRYLKEPMENMLLDKRPKQIKFARRSPTSTLSRNLRRGHQKTTRLLHSLYLHQHWKRQVLMPESDDLEFWLHPQPRLHQVGSNPYARQRLERSWLSNTRGENMWYKGRFHSTLTDSERKFLDYFEEKLYDAKNDKKTRVGKKWIRRIRNEVRYTMARRTQMRVLHGMTLRQARRFAKRVNLWKKFHTPWQTPRNVSWSERMYGKTTWQVTSKVVHPWFLAFRLWAFLLQLHLISFVLIPSMRKAAYAYAVKRKWIRNAVWNIAYLDRKGENNRRSLKDIVALNPYLEQELLMLIHNLSFQGVTPTKRVLAWSEFAKGHKFLWPWESVVLRYPIAYHAGVLLVGPPGTGKTLLGQALAGSANVRFLGMTSSEFLFKGIKSGPTNIHHLFLYARHNAPCVLFIDEIDTLTTVRTGRALQQNILPTTVGTYRDLRFARWRPGLARRRKKSAGEFWRLKSHLWSPDPVTTQLYFEHALNVDVDHLHGIDIGSRRAKAASWDSKDSSALTIQMLTEIDGCYKKSKVFLMGSTNRITRIDAAITRPGRIDRIIHLSRPNNEQRLEMLEHYLKEQDVEFPMRNLNFYHVHAMTVGMTAADISTLVNESKVYSVLQRVKLEKKLGRLLGDLFPHAHTTISMERGVDVVTSVLSADTRYIAREKTLKLYQPFIWSAMAYYRAARAVVINYLPPFYFVGATLFTQRPRGRKNLPIYDKVDSEGHFERFDANLCKSAVLAHLSGMAAKFMLMQRRSLDTTGLAWLDLHHGWELELASAYAYKIVDQWGLVDPYVALSRVMLGSKQNINMGMEKRSLRVRKFKLYSPRYQKASRLGRKFKVLESTVFQQTYVTEFSERKHTYFADIPIWWDSYFYGGSCKREENNMQSRYLGFWKRGTGKRYTTWEWITPFRYQSGYRLRDWNQQSLYLDPRDSQMTHVMRTGFEVVWRLLEDRRALLDQCVVIILLRKKVRAKDLAKFVLPFQVLRESYFEKQFSNPELDLTPLKRRTHYMPRRLERSWRLESNRFVAARQRRVVLPRRAPEWISPTSHSLSMRSPLYPALYPERLEVSIKRMTAALQNINQDLDHVLALLNLDDSKLDMMTGFDTSATKTLEENLGVPLGLPEPSRCRRTNLNPEDPFLPEVLSPLDPCTTPAKQLEHISVQVAYAMSLAPLTETVQNWILGWSKQEIHILDLFWLLLPLDSKWDLKTNQELPSGMTVHQFLCMEPVRYSWFLMSNPDEILWGQDVPHERIQAWIQFCQNVKTHMRDRLAERTLTLESDFLNDLVLQEFPAIKFSNTQDLTEDTALRILDLADGWLRVADRHQAIVQALSDVNYQEVAGPLRDTFQRVNLQEKEFVEYVPNLRKHMCDHITHSLSKYCFAVSTGRKICAYAANRFYNIEDARQRPLDEN